MAGWSLQRRRKGASARAEVMPDYRLEGERVCLRPPMIEDWPAWAAVRGRNREHLEPFEPQWSDTCLGAEFFNRRLDRQTREWLSGRGYSFLIFRKEPGSLIGGVNINNVTRGAAQFASIGYWIDADLEGQGYMRESLTLILSFCFGELRLNRVNAACLPHNERSIGLLKRLGFEEEGFAKRYIQINGDYADHLLFGLLAQDFGKPQ